MSNNNILGLEFSFQVFCIHNFVIHGAIKLQKVDNADITFTWRQVRSFFEILSLSLVILFLYFLRCCMFCFFVWYWPLCFGTSWPNYELLHFEVIKHRKHWLCIDMSLPIPCHIYFFSLQRSNIWWRRIKFGIWRLW